ncbi:PfkB family carbohydrate kinase [Streptomyces sp. NPDC059881]|uniref:PfkB family carbohydrate kinase n=1 Tax=Streptomyces sp. NPDC059881 TaxID=3346986 RepID=UPI00365B3FB8
MPSVHVVGSLNADQLLEVTAFPGAGETVLGSGMRITAGGKGGNQAVAAARGGARTAMVGATGDDAHGRLVRDALDGAGVCTASVRTTAEAHTGLAVVLLEPGGDNRIIVTPGANASLTEADAAAGLAAVEPGDIVLLQLEIPPTVVAHAARTARARGATVVLNAAPAPTDSRALTPGDLDVLVVNDPEAHAVARLLGLTGHTTPEERVIALARALDALVVCTMGADGAYAAPAGGRRPALHVPAVPVVPVDTTAAGDTFTGYLAAALAEGVDDLSTALNRAAAAAALAVTRSGAMASIPARREVLRARASLPTAKD